MQNSNLSTKIFPLIQKDWLDFINEVSLELDSMVKTNNRDIRRIKELSRHISKIEEIDKICNDNIETILNYRDFFVYIDNSLGHLFDALNFFKEKNNLDNDAVNTIYHEIINSPEIEELTSEYKNLLIKNGLEKKQIKDMDDLVNENGYNTQLIKDLLNKYNFDDKKKKNVLFYTVVMSSIKEHDYEEDETKIVDENEVNRDKFKKLCELYLELKEDNNIVLSRCYQIKQNMQPSELDMYKGYINNPSEIDNENIKDSEKLKVYTLAIFKIQKDINQYIDCINEFQSSELDLIGEISYFKELVNDYQYIIKRTRELLKEKKMSFEGNVLFALDPFNRLLIDKELLIDNKDDILTFINNYDTKNVKVEIMENIEEIEELLRKEIYLVSTHDFKLAYVMVNNCVLVLDGANANDNRFNQNLKYLVKSNIIAIRKQIDMIMDMNQDYINLEQEIISDVMKNNSK